MSVGTPHFLLFSEATTNAGAGHRVGTGGRTGRWRIVLETIDGAKQFEASDEEDEPSERLELLAVVRGLEALEQPSRVTLVTPSRYVSRGLRFGLAEWRENGWQWERFGQMSPVPHADLWQRVDQALCIHEVRWKRWRFDEAHPRGDEPKAAVVDGSSARGGWFAAVKSRLGACLGRFAQRGPRSWQLAN